MRKRPKNHVQMTQKIPKKILFNYTPALPSIWSYNSKSLVNAQQKKKNDARKGKEKGRRESKRKKSRLLCHFLTWNQSQNFAFCTCPNFRSSSFASETEGSKVHNLWQDNGLTSFKTCFLAKIPRGNGLTPSLFFTTSYHQPNKDLMFVLKVRRNRRNVQQKEQ